MSAFRVMLVAVAIFAVQSAWGEMLGQHEPLALRSAKLNPGAASCYRTLELKLDLQATYDNPFDPDDIDVHADFTSPQGKTFRVNGFLDRPYTRRLENGSERIDPVGPPVWKIRFTPDRVGSWRYRVSAHDRVGMVTLPTVALQVRAADAPGFIRRSARNPAVFAYENGRPFFAVGENMGWGGGRGSFSYDDWLPALHRDGGNWIRIWISPGNCALEWPEGSPGTSGLGVYNLANAWKLDTILDTAARNGIAVMVCLGTYGEFTTGGYFHEGLWASNPYNAANGGPCRTPQDFWTDPTARKMYRQRLRYLAARYGCRTNVQAWEFWNEADAPASWIGEMARFLKGTGEFAGRPADPYRHLLTTTYGTDAVWKIPEIDFTETHSYGEGNIPDHAPPIHADALHSASFGKPHLMAEFGIDWRDSDSKYDPGGLGVNLHNGLWSGALSGDAGGAMIWWWDNYIAPENIYGQFLPLRRFVDTVPWTVGPWQPLAAGVEITQAVPETFSDLVLAAGNGWGRAAATEFRLDPTGKAELPTLPGFLYSPGKTDLRTTPTFQLHCDRPCRFVVRVDSVSDSARLQFRLDGKVVSEQALSATPPTDPSVRPEYETTQFRPEYQDYLARFNKDYGIDVSAGDHTVTLDNTAGDWISVESYTVTGYRSSRYPGVNLYGLRHGREAVLWVQNGRHDWKNVHDHVPIPPIRGATLFLHDLPPGSYRVEWWDTTRGVVTKRETAVSVSGDLPLTLPTLDTDVAAKVGPTD